MSHDQKPARMRVVASAGGAPQRRRDEIAGAPGTAPEGSADVPVSTGAPTRGPLLPALFLVGCAMGGAALPIVRAL